MTTTSGGEIAARGKTVLIGGLVAASLLATPATASPLITPLRDTGAGGGVATDVREQPELDRFERRLPG